MIALAARRRRLRSGRGVVGNARFAAHVAKLLHRVTSAEERVFDLDSAMPLQIEDELEFDGAFSKVVKQSD
ncbi:MAG: hypothetical protein V8S24_01560 [Gordonibacter pamelaeae]